jgi:hypothetical protein
MRHQTTLEKLFDQAVTDFPYKLERLDPPKGDLKPDKNGSIHYEQAVSFPAGQVFGEELTAIGLIELDQDDTYFGLNASLEVVILSQWGQDSVYGHKNLNATYEPRRHTWDLYVG